MSKAKKNPKAGKRPKTKAKTNTGKGHEKAVRDIYQSLMALHGPDFANIMVQHNVRLPSRSTPVLERQIDVYWEFELAGVKYKTCVQAKDCNKPITLDKIDTFHNVLSDLAGQPRGIMVTKKGLQSGADAYARNLGIELIELTNADQQTIDQTLTYAKVHANRWYIQNFAYQPDGTWMLQNKATGFEYGFNRNPGETPIYRADATVLTLVKDIVHPDKEQPGAYEHEHFFQEPAFIETGDPALPKVKILSVKTTINVIEILPATEVKRVADKVFRSATGGQSYTIDGVGQIRKAGEPITFHKDLPITLGDKQVLVRIQFDKKDE